MKNNDANNPIFLDFFFKFSLKILYFYNEDGGYIKKFITSSCCKFFRKSRVTKNNNASERFKLDGTRNRAGESQ